MCTNAGDHPYVDAYWPAAHGLGYEHGFVSQSADIVKAVANRKPVVSLPDFADAYETQRVLEAAVIGVPHPRWQERPLLIVTPRAGAELTREQVLAHLEPRIARWWMPDDVVVLDELPHTATGKIWKIKLREAFKDYRLPTA